MILVGFSGYARSGKDTAAEALRSLGFIRISFADKLRDFIYEFNPLVEYHNFLNNGAVEYNRLRNVIDMYGWDGYKETIWGDDIRRQLQVLGTECGRMIIDNNIWVDSLFNTLPYADGKYVIADVRFPNEAEGIRNRGGKIFRIEREGVEAVNIHASETALDDYEFDGIIHNDGTIGQFMGNVRRKILESGN